MHIKSIDLDGFKSYAKKQHIAGFHSQFNAITGYNGSGKSNILDGICFLLGITKLENIRAKSMTDLIFKQGQAGVNKAVVTIVFDNTDKSTSPLGLSDHNEIVIRRQICAGNGRGAVSSYTFNGQPATNSRIADFFRGIGLNVNNPHFLIMQGRITKVLNMKPDEILGMIEEAAGTKMYDQKKKDTQRTLLQKDAKLQETRDIIENNLEPKMEKMREDRKIAIELVKANKAKSTVERKLNAYVYWRSLQGEEDSKQQVESTSERIENSEQRIVEIGDTIVKTEQKLADLETNKNEENSNTEFEEELKKKTEQRVTVESERDEVKENMKEIEEDRKRRKASIENDKKALSKKKDELEKVRAQSENAATQSRQDEEDMVKYRNQMEALARGMMTNDQGETVSIEAKIQESRTEAADIEATLKTALNRKDRLGPRIDELQKQYERQSKQQANEMNEVKLRENEVKKTETALAKIRFDEDKEANMRSAVEKLKEDVADVESKMSKVLKEHARVDFSFRDPPIPGFDRERDVWGTVATLFTVKDPKFAYAVEIASGGFLSQVVVSNQNVARSMVEHRVFQGRKTLIPVKETRKKTTSFQARLEPNRFQAAQRVADKYGERVMHIIDLVDFQPELLTIMENIFGSILVTESLACAKEIAYHPQVRIRTVTLRGDDVKPNGIMTGGYTDLSRGCLLNAMIPFNGWRLESKQKRQEISQIEGELEAQAEIARQYYETKESLSRAQMRLNAIHENIKNSELGVIQGELQTAQKEFAEVSEELKEKKEKMKQLKAMVEELESRKKNEKQYQEREMKKIKEQLTATEKRAAKNRETGETATRLIMGKTAEVDELAEQIKKELESIEGRQVELNQLQHTLDSKQKEVDQAVTEEKEVRSKLDALKKKIRAADDEMKKVMKSIDSFKRETLKIKSQIETYNKERDRYVDDERTYRSMAAKMKKKCEWIEQESQHFGKKNTEYDFTGFSEEKGKNQVEECSKKVSELERKVNPKINNVFDSAEAKLVDLKKKKTLVEMDREKIIETLVKLDERKDEEIKRAHSAVNKDFGNIFSTLLPGTHAKLCPPDGKSVLDGVEVKVAFNGQWKESLQELSGGQRSLVALSLILAMLKFKPAPLYILDEVDAALDLSHTANIGKMIKKHFTNSQFVVVSLKEGMFSNANVLFQTKFVDGTSTVRRTENFNV